MSTSDSNAHRDANAASASVVFVGSGLAFLGQGSNWAGTGSDGLPRPAGIAYVVGDATWADTDAEKNIMQPTSDTVVWQRSTPRFQSYTMSMLAEYGNWTLGGAQVMTGMNSSASSLADVPTRVEKFINDDGKLNSFYNTTGRWEVTPASNNLPVYAMCYDNGIVRVDVPAGTAYILINGTRSLTTGNIYVVFETDEYGDRTTDVINTHFSLTTEALLYMRPLYPNKKYTLIVTCAFGASQGQQGFTSMTFYEGST